MTHKMDETKKITIFQAKLLHISNYVINFALAKRQRPQA